MSVGEVNNAISGAINALTETRGAYEARDKTILETFGTKPGFVERADELQLFLPDSSCVTDGKGDLGEAAYLAEAYLGDALNGTSRKELAQNVQLSINEARVRATGNVAVVAAMMDTGSDLREAIERVIDLGNKYEQQKEQHQRNTDAAVVARERAVDYLQQLYL